MTATKVGLWRPAWWGAGAVGLLAVACSDFADPQDLLEVEPDSDGAESQEVQSVSAAPGAGDWSCLGEQGLPPLPAPADPPTFQLTVRARNFGGGDVPNARVRACPPIDVDCDEPVFEGVADETGTLVVPLPGGFDGTLEFEADGIVNARSYLPGPVTEDATFGIGIFPSAALAGLVASAGVSLRQELAVLVVAAYDCQYQTASGVRISNDTGGLTYYFAGGLPSPRLQATDGSGVAGFVNVPEGLVAVSAVAPAEDQLLATRLVHARGGWFTHVYLAPPSVPTHAGLEDLTTGD